MTALAQIAQQIGVTGAADILLLSLLIYALLSLLRRSRLAGAATGAFVLAVVYLLARLFALSLTASVLEATFAVLVVGAIVVFRDELRRFLEQLARFGKRRLGAEGLDEHAPAAELAEACHELVTQRYGALFVLRREDDLGEHLAQGHRLDGEVSATVLVSLFDHHSPGHDGAMVIDRGRIERFGCHLPLSTDAKQLRGLGTRHAAALGLAEVSDALCLVVSEERGSVRIAEGGQLGEPLTAAELAERLGALEATAALPARSFLRRHALKGLSVSAALGLWLVLVYGAQPRVESIEVPVRPVQAQEGARQLVITPARVTVTLAGPRRAFYFLRPTRLRVLLPLAKRKAWHNLSVADVNAPRSLTVRAIQPSTVRVRRARKAPSKRRTRKGEPSAAKAP
jgi:diadenylate cyclase